MNCKYCLEPVEDAASEDFIAPCKCSGSMGMVHKTCLLAWIDVKPSWPMWKCETCLAPIRYNFTTQSWLQATRAFVRTFRFDVFDAIRKMECRCHQSGCVCLTVLAWSERAAAMLSVPLYVGAVMWLAFWLIGVSAQLRDCIDMVSFVVDVLLSINQFGSIAAETRTTRYKLTALLVLPQLYLFHYLFPVPRGFAPFVTWAIATIYHWLALLRIAMFVAILRFQRARLQCELRHLLGDKYDDGGATFC